ncbi:MAG: transposase [Syntrophomonas sp.]|uniref:transposase n=1 Tax=Syntrophomonas sp. TaxID=2053627 RepID=UPI002630F22B|nr:transposase [Syntrophomonas sp.]MDD4627703.1 transposase [Syntrophomonas sp.]
MAVQTFGDFLNFNPHLHIIASDGCFATDGGFMVGFRRNWARMIQKIYHIATLIATKGSIRSARRVIHYFAQNVVVTCELYPLSKIWLS